MTKVCKLQDLDKIKDPLTNFFQFIWVLLQLSNINALSYYALTFTRLLPDVYRTQSHTKLEQNNSPNLCCMVVKPNSISRCSMGALSFVQVLCISSILQRFLFPPFSLCTQQAKHAKKTRSNTTKAHLSINRSYLARNAKPARRTRTFSVRPRYCT